MKTIALYTSKGSTTGKALRLKFNAIRKQTNRKAKCDLLLRWGSTESFPSLKYKKELNTLEAVKRTTNKLEMLTVLKAASIPTPEFGTSPEQSADFKDRSGNFYIRSKAGVVRYGSDYNPTTDQYYSKPIKFKRREYRVHVFNGKVIGLYEKIPNDPNPENRPKLFKSETCRFVRSNPEISRVDPAAQQICIDAVRALGLLFGGVDLIRDKNGQFFITEVNSAPGLNSQMLERYVNEIKSYIVHSEQQR